MLETLRSHTGVLILDLNNRLLYFNQEALNLLKDLEDVPPEVQRSCDEVKAHANNCGSEANSNGNRALLCRQGEGSPCFLRAFLVGSQSKDRPATHVMVLVEKAAKQC